MIMDKILKRFFCFILKCIPDNLKDEYINLTINELKNIDILTYAYNNIGILKWENPERSGEKFVIEKILKIKLNKKNEFIFFDVGANIGNYSKMLSEIYPECCIYAFEPNPKTYEILKRNIDKDNVRIFNIGLGSNNINKKIYTYKDDLQSEHASIYKNHKDVISEELSKKEVVSMNSVIKTLDSFCTENNVKNIDFIKIDTEGYEYEVLKGSKKFIEQNKIGIIQFEFNVSNILSRTFIKDFYDLLSSRYNFYRVDTEKLIPLGTYSSKNEIFEFQNILAINRNLDI